MSWERRSDGDTRLSEYSDDDEETIFGACLDLSRSGRKAYLDKACGDNDILRSRVERLLEAHDRPAEELPSRGIIPQAPPKPENIGSYRILDVIGEGGMGTVYLAEQRSPVRRRVALKVIKPGLDSKEAIGRFESERQALAFMNHPNIAQILDAGATDDGRPYFVMEYVPGLDLIAYCDKFKLGLAQRLRLFIDICHAVHYAHQKGIIHRDLKPANIIVCQQERGEPVPKVIDFGVAKAVNQRLSDLTVLTRVGGVVGTPAYMSPEQAFASPVDIDTRSDVYSLGAILYQLLVGVTPLDLARVEGGGLAEIERAIREDEPRRPSARLSGEEHPVGPMMRNRGTTRAALERRLKGELDWVVMKALAKERHRRYGSAAELAQEVSRHLSHEPVSARPPGWVYSISKLIRRHRALAAAALTVAVALLIGLGLALVGLRQARQQRDLAEHRSYLGLVYAAQAALAQNDTLVAEEALQQTPERLREWEWDYFKSQIDPSRLVYTHPDGAMSSGVDYHPSGDWIVVAWRDDTFRVASTHDGSEVAVVRVNPEPGRRTVNMATALFSRSGRTVYGATDSGQVFAWNWRTEQEQQLLPGGHDDVVSGLHLSADGSLLVTSSWDRTVKIWALPEGRLLKTLEHAAEVETVALSPDGTRIATATWDHLVTVWDTQSGQPVRTWRAAPPRDPDSC